MIRKRMQAIVFFTGALGLPWIEAHGVESLPACALARIGDHRFYHGPGIKCAVLSPDGRLAASAANYGVYHHVRDRERDAYERLIVLWDANTGERLRALYVRSGSVSRLALSNDGKLLAAAHDFPGGRGVSLFETESGKLLWQANDFKTSAGYLQFSTDGKQLRVSECLGCVSAWDVSTRKQLRLWKAPPEMFDEDKHKVCGVIGRMSPDGKVIVWEMRRLRENDSPWEAAGLRVHDTVTDQLLYTKQFHLSGPLWPIGFSANGQRFAALCPKFTVWETATGKALFAREAPHVEGFALAPDGQHAVSYELSSRLCWWDLSSEQPARDLYLGFVGVNYNHFKSQQVFSAGGRTLLLAADSTLRLFDTKTGKERGGFHHRAPVTPRFSEDGRTLFTSCGDRRCRWRLTPGQQPTFLKAEPRKVWEIRCLAHSADEQHFLDDMNHRVRIRETTTGRVLHTLEGKLYPRAGLLSPDAAQVLLYYYTDNNYSAKLFRLYDSKTGKPSDEIKPELNVGLPVFSHDGRLFAWTDETAAIHLHDTTTGRPVQTLRSSSSFKTGDVVDSDLRFSPDGTRLIVMTYPYDFPRLPWTALPMRVFDISSGREILRFCVNPEKKSKTGKLSCMSCSPDSRLLAIAEKDSGTIRLLEIGSGRVRGEFAGHRHGVQGLAFSPDGKLLASGGEDNVVFLWDTTGALTPPAMAEDLEESWNDLASDDGKRVRIAIASLLRNPEASVAFLQTRLHPARGLDETRMAQLLADLDADLFEKRERASRELARLGESAEAALRRELTNHPSLELRRRIEDMLSKLEPVCPPRETLRTLRAIEVLEHIGTTEARRCLHTLAKGAKDARPTSDAIAALQRLANRRDRTPIPPPTARK